MTELEKKIKEHIKKTIEEIEENKKESFQTVTDTNQQKNGKMKIGIRDCRGNIKLCDIPDKPIKWIVHGEFAVITLILIRYEDGEQIMQDSCLYHNNNIGPQINLYSDKKSINEFMTTLRANAEKTVETGKEE